MRHLSRLEPIMEPPRVFKKGQRWEFSSDVAEFEAHLVIWREDWVHASTGKEKLFTVFVPFSGAGRKVLPSTGKLALEGAFLTMTAPDLDRSVTNLRENEVKLPSGQDRLPPWSCTVLRETLPKRFEALRSLLDDEQKRHAAMQRTMSELRKAGPPKRSNSIAESWSRIAEFLKNIEEGFSVNKGASPTDIDRLETLIGAQLPRSYANDSSDWKVRDCHGPIKPIFWSAKRIPVTDNSGDHLILDLDPPADGVNGQVIHHSHEVGPLQVLASSWADFLANLVDDLESGKYYYDDSAYLKRIEE